jgi:ABC-2 type transport system permease protein
MKKYFAIYLISLKETINYRMELFLWSVIDAMPLIAMMALWLSAFGSRTEINGYTKSGIITYFLAGFIVQDITGSYFEENILEKIRNGSIVTSLIKPYSVKLKWIVAELGWRNMTLIFTVLPVIIISTIFLKGNISISFSQTILLLPIILIISYLLETFYSLMIAAMGFVFEEANSLSHLKWMLGWLFSGSMLPFEMMPDWLAKIANFLPFKFRYYIPVQIIRGELTLSETILQLIFQFVWLIIIGKLLNMLWNRNLKLFTAVGS